MADYQILMKDLGSSEDFADVTSDCSASSFTIREGFGSLGSSPDVSKLSVQYRADDLAAAALLHTTAKHVQIYQAGTLIFEGYSEDSAEVTATANSSISWVTISFYPFSKAFSKAVCSEDLYWEGLKICDPDDEDNSLLHQMYHAILDNLPSPYKELLASAELYCTKSITKVLEFAVIEAEDNIEDAFDDLLHEFGLVRYTVGLQTNIVEPYADDESRAVQSVPFESIMSDLSISPAPYLVENKLTVTLGLVSSYENEQVYQMYDDDESPSEDDKIERYVDYPEDGDLEIDYEPERAEDNDDLELIYTTGRSYSCLAKESGGTEVSLTVSKEELNAVDALFRFMYTGSTYAYINQLTITAAKAYYRDTSITVTDTTGDTTGEDDYESVYMTDTEDAENYIKVYRAESKAETSTYTFRSSRAILEPNTLCILGNINAVVLVRYRTLDLITGIYTYEGVIFDLVAVNTANRVHRGSGTMKFINLQLTATSYKYDSSGSLSPSDQSIIATVKRYGTTATPTWYINDEEQSSSSTSITVPASAMTDDGYIHLKVVCGTLAAETYIFKVSDGSDGSAAEADPAWIARMNPSTYQLSSRGVTTEEQTLKLTFEIISGTSRANGASLTVTTSGYVTAKGGGTDSSGNTFYQYTIKKGFPDASFSISAYATFTLSDGTTKRITKTVTVNGVKSGTAKAEFLGTYEDGTTPSEASDGPLMVGDYYLKTVTDSDGNVDKVPMFLSSFDDDDNPVWLAVTTENVTMSQYGQMMSDCLGSALASKSVITSVSALYGWFQNFAAVAAFIRFLTAKNLLIETSTFSFEVTSVDDSGNDLSEPVIKATYGGSVVFQIVPSTGRVFIGKPNSALTKPEEGLMYDPSDNTFRSANDNVIINLDGSLYAINSTFSGNFDCAAIKAKPSTNSTEITISCGTYGNQGYIIATALAANGYPSDTLLPCSTSANSSIKYLKYSTSTSIDRLYFYNDSLSLLTLTFTSYNYKNGSWTYGATFSGSTMLSYTDQSFGYAIASMSSITVGEDGQILVVDVPQAYNSNYVTGQVYRDENNFLKVRT